MRVSKGQAPPFRGSLAISLTTTTQLLDALRVRDDGDAWTLLVRRYAPVLRAVGRRLGLNDADADDAAQQTLFELVRDLRAGKFDRTRGGLRSWTLGILRHRIRDLQRFRAARPDDGIDAIGGIGGIAATVGAPSMEDVWREEFERQVLVLALAQLRSESGELGPSGQSRQSSMAESTLRAFEFTAIRGVPAKAAAEACDMTLNAVYIARNRVLARLRTIAAAIEAAMEPD